MLGRDENLFPEVLCFPNDEAVAFIRWIFHVFYIVLFGSVLCFFGLGVLCAADSYTPIVNVYLESSTRRLQSSYVPCSKFQNHQVT